MLLYGSKIPLLDGFGGVFWIPGQGDLLVRLISTQSKGGNQSYDTIDLCLLYVRDLPNPTPVSFGDINLLRNGQRVYLIGNSMGGYGTWQLAMSVPELFAAIVPVCGGGMYWNAGRLQNVPVWAFHGGKDPTVFVEESQKMVDAVNRKGGNAKLTVYPEHKHDSWTDTFSNRAVYDWLLTHENAAAALTDEYNNAEAYG